MGFVFIDIDTQYDFVMPEGALYVPGAENLIPNFERLYALAEERGIPVVATMDAHTPDDPEFEEYGFPPHCVKGTPGQLKIPATVREGAVIVPREGGAAPDELPPQLVIEKVAFSVFTNPLAAELLVKTIPELAGMRIGQPEYVVFGVATDYCVKAAALGLAGQGAKVWVVQDAIAPVERETGEKALAEMEAAGVRFITTDGVARMVEGAGVDVE